MLLLLRREEGQGLAEYALILSLIAILAVTALFFMSGKLDTLLSKIGNKLCQHGERGRTGRESGPFCICWARHRRSNDPGRWKPPLSGVQSGSLEVVPEQGLEP